MKIDDFFSSLAVRLKPNAIRRLAHLINRPGVITFAGGVPSPETFPSAAIAEMAARLISARGAEVLQYGVTRGRPDLIEAVQHYMKARAIECATPELLLASGSQQALDLVARVLIEPGDIAIVELPSYIGGTCALNNAGAELVGCHMQEDGLDLAALEDRVITLTRSGRRVKVIYTIPNFQNPSGITLSAAKRAELLALAARHNILILEDDPYGELYFTDTPPAAPIKSLDREGRVIYFGSFSKVLTPGLRTAWIIAAPEIAARVEMAKETADLCSSMLDQAIVMDCFRTGLMPGRTSELRDFYRARCAAMLEALARYAPATARWTRPTGGLFVWVELPAAVDATALLERAVEAGVAFVPGRPFFVDESGDNTLRLAFSKEPPERIKSGVEKLCALI